MGVGAASGAVAVGVCPRFAHASERHFAGVLDFYGIDWEYEPTEFVLEWDEHDRPTLAFRPDFYLPVFDLYIELTTLNQRLVTKKNRKVRRLRELRPDVKVKVLYLRDYLSLGVKFGLDLEWDRERLEWDRERLARQ